MRGAGSLRSGSNCPPHATSTRRNVILASIPCWASSTNDRGRVCDVGRDDDTALSAVLTLDLIWAGVEWNFAPLDPRNKGRTVCQRTFADVSQARRPAVALRACSTKRDGRSSRASMSVTIFRQAEEEVESLVAFKTRPTAVLPPIADFDDFLWWIRLSP